MGLKTLTKDQLSPQVCVIVGTRPSIIKQAPTIRELQQQQIPYFIIHTGQHYSYELDRVFFEDLQLPEPRFRLQGIERCKFHGEQTGEMLKQIEQILLTHKPRIVLVGGDANTNLAGALAARKLNVMLAHEESGLRSYQWNVPEEHNRVIIDHIADYLFVPHERAEKVLKGEGVRGKIFVTGSTIVDAVAQHLGLALRKSTILADLSLQKKNYLLMTLHHEENVDYYDELANIVAGITRIGTTLQLPIIFPIHPRTANRLNFFNLTERIAACPWVKTIPPLGYLDFTVLTANAGFIITDSGGLIQEAAIHGVPCLTLGKYTEWLETIEIGANLISGNDPETMVQYAMRVMQQNPTWQSPFGKPGAAKRIVDILKLALQG